MQAVLLRLSQLDPSLAFLLFLVGMVYGLFGWRTIRFLVLLDALALAILLGIGLREVAGQVGLFGLWLLPVFLLLLGLPWAAWRFPRPSAIGFSGLVGFFSVALFLLDAQLPMLAWLALGSTGAALAMALATTLLRQTAMVVTGFHGAWLCVAALALLSAHPSHLIGGFLGSVSTHSTIAVPAAAAIISSIFIAVQWSGLNQEADALYITYTPWRTPAPHAPLTTQRIGVPCRQCDGTGAGLEKVGQRRCGLWGCAASGKAEAGAGRGLR